MTKGAGTTEYKGHPAKILMMGTKKAIPGWGGELFVAVIEYGEEKSLQYDVIPDSTNAADLEELPAVQTFTDRGEAVAHFMKLERNKDKWK